MRKWQEKLGDDATYNNLISVFERSGHLNFADFIKNLEPEVKLEKKDESRDVVCPQTPPHRYLPVLHVEQVILHCEKGNVFHFYM